VEPSHSEADVRPKVSKYSSTDKRPNKTLLCSLSVWMALHPLFGALCTIKHHIYYISLRGDMHYSFCMSSLCCSACSVHRYNVYLLWGVHSHLYTYSRS
jgi:hypothetical protein